ncbi:MAG TPA: tetratricopeptide repeat protein, partial [Terriglobales bacterium]|nr:tetratricopeptide repeat protein [Terriglobales bacterium]
MTELAILVLALGMIASAQSINSSAATGRVDAPSASQFAHARQLLQQGKYDEAIAELQQLASSRPGTKGLPHELGTAYYRKGDYSHAIDSLKQALQSDPADNEATQLVGLSFYL